MDNVVLHYREQQRLVLLLDPLRRELVKTYRDNTVGTVTLNGWIPYTLFYNLAEQFTTATPLQISKGLSTNLYDRQPTAAATLQV